MLKTDATFCASGEVKRIMKNWRQHQECKVGEEEGCEVLVGRRCERVKRDKGTWAKLWRGLRTRRAGQSGARTLLGAALAIECLLGVFFCFGGYWIQGRPVRVVE